MTTTRERCSAFAISLVFAIVAAGCTPSTDSSADVTRVEPFAVVDGYDVADALGLKPRLLPSWFVDDADSAALFAVDMDTVDVDISDVDFDANVIVAVNVATCEPLGIWLEVPAVSDESNGVLSVVEEDSGVGCAQAQYDLVTFSVSRADLNGVRFGPSGAPLIDLVRNVDGQESSRREAPGHRTALRLAGFELIDAVDWDDRFGLAGYAVVTKQSQLNDLRTSVLRNSSVEVLFDMDWDSDALVVTALDSCATGNIWAGLDDSGPLLLDPLRPSEIACDQAVVGVATFIVPLPVAEGLSAHEAALLIDRSQRDLSEALPVPVVVLDADATTAADEHPGEAPRVVTEGYQAAQTLDVDPFELPYWTAFETDELDQLATEIAISPSAIGAVNIEEQVVLAVPLTTCEPAGIWLEEQAGALRAVLREGISRCDRASVVIAVWVVDPDVIEDAGGFDDLTLHVTTEYSETGARYTTTARPRTTQVARSVTLVEAPDDQEWIVESGNYVIARPGSDAITALNELVDDPNVLVATDPANSTTDRIAVVFVDACLPMQAWLVPADRSGQPARLVVQETGVLCESRQPWAVVVDIADDMPKDLDIDVEVLIEANDVIEVRTFDITDQLG